MKLINRTPVHLRCSMGGCPAVYDITPPHLKCTLTASCPSVSKIGDGGQLLIIGRVTNADEFPELKGKVGIGEEAIVIGAEYFTDLVQTRAEPGQAPSGHPAVERLASAAQEILGQISDEDGFDKPAEKELFQALQAFYDASAPRQIEEPQRGDTGAPLGDGQPDTNFEAKARKIVEDRRTGDRGMWIDTSAMGELIAIALRESYETGAVEGKDIIVENLKARVSELEARLEMDHMFELAEDGETMVRVEIAPEDRRFSTDGIECRDATILLQGEHIKKLKSENAALQREVDAGRQEASEGCPVLPKAASPASGT